jgi:hypothetical protein
MTFRVTIVEIFPETQTPQEVKRFEQTVDAIDLMRVIDAVNTPPKPKRVRKAKAQKNG